MGACVRGRSASDLFNKQTCIIVHIFTPSQTHTHTSHAQPLVTQACVYVCVCAGGGRTKESREKFIRCGNKLLLCFSTRPLIPLSSHYLPPLYIFSHLISWAGNKFHVLCASRCFIYLSISLLELYRFWEPDSIIRQVASPASLRFESLVNQADSMTAWALLHQLRQLLCVTLAQRDVVHKHFVDT